MKCLNSGNLAGQFSYAQQFRKRGFRANLDLFFFFFFFFFFFLLVDIKRQCHMDKRTVQWAAPCTIQIDRYLLKQ